MKAVSALWENSFQVIFIFLSMHIQRLHGESIVREMEKPKRT